MNMIEVIKYLEQHLDDDQKAFLEIEEAIDVWVKNNYEKALEVVRFMKEEE
jgi:hypothetical protein